MHPLHIFMESSVNSILFLFLLLSMFSVHSLYLFSLLYDDNPARYPVSFLFCSCLLCMESLGMIVKSLKFFSPVFLLDKLPAKLLLVSY